MRAPGLVAALTRRAGARVLAAVPVVALLALAAAAHVRLRHPGNANPLFWLDPTNVSIVVNSGGSDDIPDGSHETALRNAIQAWNAAGGTTAQLVENTDPVQQARTDWAADGIHLILFDETNSSGYFPFGSGTVAVTPIWFFSNGRISDADVLFNGSGFAFTTSGQAGRFDVQDVGTHELGHLLGLDHTGFVGGSMYPYVSPTTILHRSLSVDEVRGLHDMYPSGALGTITGAVRRAGDSSIVLGAHVVARDSNGRTAGGALTNLLGAFTLVGLPADAYTVYATPLEGPVSVANLGGGQVVQIDFASTEHGVVVVGAGQSVAVGDVFVDADVGVSLGKNTTVFPLRAVAGTTAAFTVAGKNLDGGTALLAGDPALTVTPLVWSATQVTFNLTVPAGAAPGHVDLTAVAGAALSTLPAAVEVTPADPTVTGVAPGAVDQAGGTVVTLTGTGFNPGARVVIGEHVYVDGEPGGCTVVDPTTITLSTLPSQPGTYDVVVIDATGVEGRAGGGLAVTAAPVLDTLFPASGTFTGGTSLVVTGSDFVDGLIVSIDGVVQGNVTRESSALIRVVTAGGAPGGPYTFQVQNPGGSVATTLFTYVASADPVLVDVDPATASAAGGALVTVGGSGFTPTSAVTFGADAATGLGGVASPDVVFVDANTLEVVVPPHASGAVTVLVTETTTGQADLVEGAFTYRAANPGGGGGGGCSAGTAGGRGGWRAAEPFAWVLLAWLAVGLGLRGPRRGIAT